jgi:hypothetical protein
VSVVPIVPASRSAYEAKPVASVMITAPDFAALRPVIVTVIAPFAMAAPN